MPFDMLRLPLPSARCGRLPLTMADRTQARGKQEAGSADADRCLRAVRAVGDEIERIAKVALHQSWTKPPEFRNPELAKVLKEVRRLRQLSDMLDRQLQGRMLEVDRRNLAQLLGVAYDSARDGVTDRKVFVDRLVAFIEAW